MASRDAATFQVYRPMAMPTPAALPPSSQQITMPFTAALVDAVLPAPRKAAATQGGKDRHSKEAQAYASSVAQVHHLNLLSALSGAATRRPAQEESR
ncbi:hypothetical protein OsJ_15526 [Oryza sativa Japonica Group]|uniref:Uncharacterized protein n=1 Tax=Oryza sativa subsp. japonica TaxID=39947 RepID=A3AVQ8_ORYSJ|nr:hypothetical protein OsJ_15526 [Oryza sativa Japonica Group]